VTKTFLKSSQEPTTRINTVRLSSSGVLCCWQRYDKEEELGTPRHIIEWITQVLGTTDNLPQVRTFRNWFK